MMENLPFFLDADDAVEYYLSTKNISDAAKAYVVATLSNEGLVNKEIRSRLNIEKVYTVTHLKRVGTSLSLEELNLWHNNPTRITLGHVRPIAKLPRVTREEMLRNLLTEKIPVHKYESAAKGAPEQQDADIKRYERIVGEVLGRQIKIHYSHSKKSGSITLDFVGLDDLDYLTRSLGFKPEDHI